MFDEQLGQLNQSINDFLSSDVFQIGVRVLVIYFVLVWLASAFWAYRDMRQRSTSALAPYVAAAIIILFTPIFFLFGLLLYRIVRPKETIAEANERLLTEEAILAEVQSRPHCANCMRPVHDEWIICPTCRNRLRRVCPNCEHLVELDWSLCAWCGRDFERSEAPGTAYMPRARRQPAPAPAPVPASAPMPAAGPAPARPAAPRTAYSRPNPAPTTGTAGSGTATSATPAPRPSPQSASTPHPRSPGPRPESADPSHLTEQPTEEAREQVVGDLKGPPGGRVFSLEGRRAPSLYLIAWILSVGGVGLLFVGIGAAPGLGRSALLVIGAASLGMGLLFGAGYQVVERRDRHPDRYRGPAPLLTFGIVLAWSTLASSVLIGTGLLDPDTPFGFLGVLVAAALAYVVVVWLLVVRTGALTWREMGWPDARAGGGPPTLARCRTIDRDHASRRRSGSSSSAASSRRCSTSRRRRSCRLRAPPLEALAVGLAAAVVAPVGEELFFRGFALTAWMRDLGARSAIVRSAVRVRHHPYLEHRDDTRDVRRGRGAGTAPDARDPPGRSRPRRAVRPLWDGRGDRGPRHVQHAPARILLVGSLLGLPTPGSA